MKNLKVLWLMTISIGISIILSASLAVSEDKVVVIPLNSGTGLGLSDNGVIKAAVYAKCYGMSNETEVLRSFNNVNAETIKALAGASQGHCRIDFGFDISNRFWVTSASTPLEPLYTTRVVNCGVPDTEPTILNCSTLDTSTMQYGNSPIMVLIY